MFEVLKSLTLTIISHTCLQSDAELKKLKEDLEKEEKAKSKKSAAWIWEKQSLETELKVKYLRYYFLHLVILSYFNPFAFVLQVLNCSC